MVPNLGGYINLNDSAPGLGLCSDCSDSGLGVATSTACMTASRRLEHRLDVVLISTQVIISVVI